MDNAPHIYLKNIRLLLFAIYCVISFHFTDLKLFDIKINELVSLLLLPFLLISLKSVNKYFIYFFIFFCFILLVTFLVNIRQDFYLNVGPLSLLRKPYFISFSRYVEYLACLTFSIIVYKTIIYYTSRGISYSKILEKILDFNVLISLFFIAAYILTYFNFFSLAESIVLYDRTPWDSHPDLRLRGYFVEGGPLGLLYCFLYILSFNIRKRTKRLFYLGIFLLMIFLSLSKAGMIGLLAWHTYKFYRTFSHTPWLKPLFFSIAIVIFYFLAIYLLEGYLLEYRNFYKNLPYKRHDYNVVTGRIAAVFISPKMFADNALFGIGLGNYALVRNNPDYLGLLPAVKAWDAPRLGIFINLLIESGILGFLIFSGIIYRIYRRYAKLSPVSSKALKVFILICFLGVQLHFIYIWFLIGLAIAAPRDQAVDSGSAVP